MGTDDRSAWVRDALERFEGPLVAYATSVLGDGHAARDVVQDTFLRLVSADRAHVEPILPRWLYAVCRHRAVDLIRRGRVAAKSNAESLDALAPRHGSAPPEEAAAVKDDASRVLAVLATLPPGHQEVLRLKLAHGLSYADIAQVTGLSVSHVGVKLHEAMKSLRARLGVRPAAAPGAAR